MNRSYMFWLAAALGVLIGVYLYFRFVEKKEHFAVAPDRQDVATRTDAPASQAQSMDECPAGTFVEDTSVIPYNTRMRLYLSSFSTSTTDKSTTPYCPNMLRWYDLRSRNVYFNVNTIAPPSRIEGVGMPTKNVVLVGPPSDFLTDDKISYELKPFTIFFYAALGNLDLAEGQDITLFRIYAETPNSVRMILKKSALPNRTRVDLVLGNDSNRYVWNITTSTLLSNGNPSLYALTIDTNPNSNDKVATFYIGKSKYIANIRIDSPIKLGNTRMEINSEGRLVSSLFSFGFVDQKLTDAEIEKIAEYMSKQQTGVDREASNAKEAEQIKARTEIDDLRTQLAQTSRLADRYASTNEILERRANRRIQRAKKAQEEREAQMKKEEEKRAQLERRKEARAEREKERQRKKLLREQEKKDEEKESTVARDQCPIRTEYIAYPAYMTVHPSISETTVTSTTPVAEAVAPTAPIA